MNAAYTLTKLKILKGKRCLLSDAIVQISEGSGSPIQSTSRLPWPELGERQQGYYVRKAREVIETAFNCLVPGSEADLWFATMKSRRFLDQSLTTSQKG